MVMFPGEEKRRREEELKKEMTERQKETQRKLSDHWKIEEKLKETQSLLEIQRAEKIQLKREAGRFGGSYNSGSVKPPLTPPSTQTSDSGFHIEIGQQRKFIRLRNTSTEDKQLGEWQLHLQVNNNKPLRTDFIDLSKSRLENVSLCGQQVMVPMILPLTWCGRI